MLCSDLDFYLEKYLDDLHRDRARARTATILRRHLGVCGLCRARFERLRRFERDLAREVWARGEAPSPWQGLEVDLVRSLPTGGGGREIVPLPLPRALPSRAGTATGGRGASGRSSGGAISAARTENSTAGGGGRRARGGALLAPLASGRLSRLAGVLAVTLAFGALYELARVWLAPRDAAQAAAAQAYRAFLAGERDLALRTDDPASLRDWLSERLGRAAPPTPVPEGFRLVGGTVPAGRAEAATDAKVSAGPAAVIVYAPREEAEEARPTLLFVREDGTPGDPPSAEVFPSQAGGLSQLAWERDAYEFRVVSAEPPARLRVFAP